MKLTDKAPSTTKRVLLYGPPKSGKSELAGKLAEKYNLLWFDCEQGYSTLLKLPEEWKARINIVSVPDSRTFPIAAESWLKVIRGDKLSICEDHGKVGCPVCNKAGRHVETIQLNITPANTIVVFDSLTQFTNSCISHITKAQPDDYKLQLDDWGNLRVLIDKFLSQVQAARYNVVCITHEEEVEMEDGRKKIVPSSGSSKSARNTAKYFDEVYYCEVSNRKYKTVSTVENAGNNVIVGSRSGLAIEKQTVPTLLDIFTSWKDPNFTLEMEAQEVATIDLGPTEKQKAVAAISQAAEVARLEAKAVEVSAATSAVNKTPGQIALENLKNKVAATTSK